MLINKTYEAADASNKSAFRPVLLGGHIVEIVGANNYISKKGKKLLQFQFDVIEDNKFNHYFEKDCRYDEKGNLRWPNGGTKYLSSQDMGILKQLVNCINASNEEKVIVTVGEELDLNQFINKKVCCNFGLEEYYNSFDEIKTTICIRGFYSADEINDIEIPTVKLIDGNEISYEEYMKNKNKEVM